MKIKVVQYNILNGFCGDNWPFIIDKKRMKMVSKILNKEKADILVLNETFFWPFGKEEKVEDYNKFFSKLYSINAPTERMFRWAPIVISRFPLEWKDKTTKDFKFMKAKIKIGKKYLKLFALHPSHDLGEVESEKNMQHLFEDNSRPELIIGDLNAISPEDKYDKEMLIEGSRAFMKEKTEERVTDMLTGRFISKILSSGYKDTFHFKKRDFDYTMPSNMRSMDKRSAIRIDYIFASKEIKVIESGIIKNKDTDIASDHYPVYAILEI